MSIYIYINLTFETMILLSIQGLKKLRHLSSMKKCFFLSFLKSFVVEKIFWDIAPRLMTYTEGVSPVVTNILSSNKSELF